MGHNDTACLAGHLARDASIDELLARGRNALHGSGNLHAARDWFDCAFDRAEREGDAEGMARAAIGLGGLWVYEHRTSAPWARTLSRQRQALALISPTSALSLQLRIRLTAEADYRASRHSQVFHTLQQARSAGDQQALAMALSLAHHCVLGPEHAGLRRDLAEELLLTASRTGRPADRLMGLLWRTVDLFLDGDPAAERALAELSAALAEHKHQAIGFAAQAITVMLAIRAGNFERAEMLAADCLRAGEACGDADAAGWYQGQLTSIRWFQGRLAELRPMIHEHAKSPDLGVADNSHFATLAVAAADQGDHRLAAGALARLGRGDLARIPSTSTWLVTMHGAVEAAFRLGDAATAASAYRLMLPYAGQPAIASLAVACFGSVSHALGLACLTVGEPDQAVAHLRQAVRENLALSHWPAVSLSRLRLAEALTARTQTPQAGPDDVREAAHELRCARVEAAELGMILPAPRVDVTQFGAQPAGDPMADLTELADRTRKLVLVRLLGPVDLSVDGAVRPVAGLRRKAVLALLALHAGEVVSTDRLIDVVWGAHAPATATNTLQSHISHLRRVLGDRHAIRAQAPGYLLDLGGEATDVVVAKRLIRLGTTSTDPQLRARHLQSAIDVWRGHPLADLIGQIGLDEPAERLNQLLLQAKLALAETQLGLGEDARAVAGLDPLTREYPLHEHVHGRLMLALYRAGRQTDALAVYRRLRTALQADLGIEPSQPVRELETAILRQDASLDR